MKFLTVSIQTTDEGADIVSLIMIEEGSEGTAVTGGDGSSLLHGGSWDYMDEALAADLSKSQPVIVTGCFSLDYDTKILASRLNEAADYIDLGSLKIDAKITDSGDYENEWKKYYRPIKAGKLTIVPAWLDCKKKKSVLINPGSAFGTGSHETTFMCVKLMQRAKIKAKTVLDVGCGSGILGISALKLGAKSAIFIDNDPLAVSSCTQNVALNEVEDSSKIIEGNLLNGYNGDVLIANITADPLISMAGDVYLALPECGDLILSGIIDGRLNEVMAAYSGFKLIKHTKMGVWHALYYKKTGGNQ